jgi:hypothetical protein
MVSSGLVDLDFIEELRLRRWARENFVPVEQRLPTWHPVVLEEMHRKDDEQPVTAARILATQA